MDTRTLSVPDSGSTGSVDSRSYSGSGNIPDRSISSIPGDNASSMDSGMEDISSSNGLGIHKVPVTVHLENVSDKEFATPMHSIHMF